MMRYCGDKCDAETVNVSILIDKSKSFSVSGKDDVKHLKHLASGVGWEFDPNLYTTNRLKKIGMKTIRHINVDVRKREEGFFDRNGRFIIKFPRRLPNELSTTRRVNASPHIVIGQMLHEDLIVNAEHLTQSSSEEFMGLLQNKEYGPTDYEKFEKYLEAYFEYVLITQGFSDAKFEVGNEPDIAGSPHPFPPTPEKGTKELYDGYMELYRSASNAARNVERRNPGTKVILGGPALSMAYTFKYGDFNWIERFLKDVAEEALKLDFIGVHYYGNHSSLRGKYKANFPPFATMLDIIFAARELYVPGLPVWITEWGPSYHTTNDEYAIINANSVGSAWSVEFLNVLLEQGIDGALYLVTTDLMKRDTCGNWENIWGWPSLFVNPHVFDRAYPTAIYHVFDMISQLKGERVLATTIGSNAVNSFVVFDEESKEIMALIWNYDYEILESKPGIERGQWVNLTMRLTEIDSSFHSEAVEMKRWLVSETVSNAYYLFGAEGRIDSRAELQMTDEETLKLQNGSLEFDLIIPPSSVSLIVLGLK
jgi:xylan 1,4-beta-xylosidase